MIKSFKILTGALLYSIINFLKERRVSYLFFIYLFSQLLKTFIDTFFFITIFCPLRSIRSIFLSFPDPPNYFYSRYNADVASPFSNLVPFKPKFLPLIKVPETICNIISKFCLNIKRVKIISILFFFIYNIVSSTIYFALIFNFEDAILDHLRSSNIAKTFWFIFIIFLIMYKWVNLYGPYYKYLSKSLNFVKKSHEILLDAIIGNPQSYSVNFIDYAKKIKNAIFKNDKIRRHRNLLFNLLGFSVFKLISVIKYIHPYSFDPLFEYVIISIIWTALLNLSSFSKLTIIIIIVISIIVQFSYRAYIKVKYRNASFIQKNIVEVGGLIDCKLRFSIVWNDLEIWDKNDLDAHAIEPLGNEIYFGKKENEKTDGMLDVDVTSPYEKKVACENITWTDFDKMENGKYRFFVHQYAFRGGESGFKAEVEFNGLVYNYEYRKTLQQDEDVDVAYVTFENGQFNIEHSLECKEIRDKKTNKKIDPDSSSKCIIQ